MPVTNPYAYRYKRSIGLHIGCVIFILNVLLKKYALSIGKLPEPPVTLSSSEIRQMNILCIFYLPLNVGNIDTHCKSWFYEKSYSDVQLKCALHTELTDSFTIIIICTNCTVQVSWLLKFQWNNKVDLFNQWRCHPTCLAVFIYMQNRIRDHQAEQFFFFFFI